MEFAERISDLAERIKELKEHAVTEEATKTALILPFLQTLGYDTFDPRIVVPEYTSDVGTKKGEKVDYAIKRDGEPIMLIECKACGCSLDPNRASQLHRYFHNTPSARIGVLTDGIEYQFFSDLDKANVMDSRPFMKFDFNKVERGLIPELQKLTSDAFDVNVTLSAAQDLKHTRLIKSFVAEEFKHPSEALIRIFASRVYDGQLRANVVEDFRPKVAAAIQYYINDVLNERLSGAMVTDPTPSAKEVSQEEIVSSNGDGKREVVTTQEEVEGYLIVKSILREIVPGDRVAVRDTLSYCGVLLDNNNRKPICRLHFDGKQKYVGTFDNDKKETRHPIDSLDDIYNFADLLKATVQTYDA